MFHPAVMQPVSVCVHVCVFTTRLRMCVTVGTMQKTLNAVLTKHENTEASQKLPAVVRVMREITQE